MASATENFTISKHDKSVLEIIFNPNLPYGDAVEEEKLLGHSEISGEDASIEEAKALEVEGVKLAESGQFDASLEKFNNAINLAPNRASGYNNRAQALRLKGDLQGAVDDLTKAVEISGGEGKAACQALTQLGLIKKLQGDCDGALDDFEMAANLGGSFAKQQVISMNPYAALCNQMLSEVFTKIKNGEDLEQ